MLNEANDASYVEVETRIRNFLLLLGKCTLVWSRVRFGASAIVVASYVQPREKMRDCSVSAACREQSGAVDDCFPGICQE
eukprot:4960110-Amphidinium_carterae.1